jgi:hypothetical protein
VLLPVSTATPEDDELHGKAADAREEQSVAAADVHFEGLVSLSLSVSLCLPLSLSSLSISLSLFVSFVLSLDGVRCGCRRPLRGFHSNLRLFSLSLFSALFFVSPSLSHKAVAPPAHFLSLVLHLAVRKAHDGPGGGDTSVHRDASERSRECACVCMCILNLRNNNAKQNSQAKLTKTGCSRQIRELGGESRGTAVLRGCSGF